MWLYQILYWCQGIVWLNSTETISLYCIFYQYIAQRRDKIRHIRKRQQWARLKKQAETTLSLCSVFSSPCLHHKNRGDCNSVSGTIYGLHEDIYINFRAHFCFSDQHHWSVIFYEHKIEWDLTFFPSHQRTHNFHSSKIEYL